MGNRKETLREAQKKDPIITKEDVKLWCQKNLVPQNIKGFNSFVAPRSKYQIDLMVMNDLQDEGDREYPYALVCIYIG